MLIDEAVNIAKNDTDYFSEASSQHLQTSILNIEKFVKVNLLKEVSNSISKIAFLYSFVLNQILVSISLICRPRF